MGELSKVWIKRFLKAIRLIIKRDQRFGISLVNVPRVMSVFWPNTSGTYRQLSKIALEDVGSTIQLISEFGSVENSLEISLEIPQKNVNDVLTLERLLNFYGSDKSIGHNYHLIYGQLFNRQEVKRVLEIGIGSINLKIPSNMGQTGKPGASLRAFRDFFPKAAIIGLDYDSQVLFEEPRISTFQLDQRDINAMLKIEEKIGKDFDLMIDDGLHSIFSSLSSLKLFLNLIRIGGYAIIEDIPEYAINFYTLIKKLIYPNFVSTLIPCRGGYLFVVWRKR